MPPHHINVGANFERSDFLTVTLYKNKSDKRVLSKTITDGISIDNVLLLDGNDSVLTPKLIISGVNVSDYNYVYIPDFNRYYYIKSIDIVDNRRFSINCEVDVLMSFAADIKKLTVVSGKAASNYNKLLPDSLPISAKRNIIVKNLSGGEINSEFITDATNNIVISYLAGGTTNGS